MVAGMETPSTTARASQLVAEALVEGHDREVIVQRARSMGLSRGLTDVLVAACPTGATSTRRRTPRAERPGSPRRASS